MKAILLSFFLWIYRMDMPDLALLLLGFSCLFLFWKKRTKRDFLWWPVLAVWAVLVVYITVGNRSGTPSISHHFLPFHSYREVMNGGNPEILRSNFMNVALFYPAGLIFAALLSRKWPRVLRCLLATAVLLAMSAAIEWAQFRLNLGHCEIDDVIHNTLGALLGSLVCAAALPKENGTAP